MMSKTKTVLAVKTILVLTALSTIIAAVQWVRLVNACLDCF